MSKITTLFAVLFALFVNTAPFHCSANPLSEEEKNFLLLYFKEEELVVESPSRSPKSVSRVPENVTVVTAPDIKLMNAHTVADALNSITGVQVNLTGGPGSISSAAIQGSDISHVTVFMDGVPLNNLSDNVTDVGSIPVQNIEKIEIIKGPASSAWGSALGGVINIITKSGNNDKPGGVVSASYGERNTEDFRAETSGKEGRLGYYVNAGRLQTDGFRSHNDFAGNNAYTKLGYDITKNTSALFTVRYDKLSRGDAEDPVQDIYRNNKQETAAITFSINSSLNEKTALNLSFWRLRQSYDFYYYRLSSGAQFLQQHFEDSGYGSSAKLFWKHEFHNVVIGMDIDRKKLTSNTLPSGEQELTKSAFFANDTLSFGRVSVTPGLRNDHTNLNGDFTSPSLGLTVKIADATLLRADVARGFNIPPLSASNANPDLKMETVWSYEAGAETAALRYAWLKLSGFRHEIKDVIARDISGKPVNSEKRRQQGIEIEVRTTPVYNTSLFGGVSFINTKDPDTGETVPDFPQKTYDLGLQYNDERSFKALLKGHYIYWNSFAPLPSYEGKYDSFIFDLHLTDNLYNRGTQMIEVFFDIHNIFNGSQYALAPYNNPQRWLEAGLRYSF